jgi:hypothetical protein
MFFELNNLCNIGYIVIFYIIYVEEVKWLKK